MTTEPAPAPQSAPTPAPQSAPAPAKHSWRRVLMVAVLAVVVLAIGPWATLHLMTASSIHAAGEVSHNAEVALVLGAGLDPNGAPSPFLRERVEVGARLFLDGKVKALLLSGDNSRSDYDETSAMAGIAAELGVPSAAIVLDYAGFDSYSSCYRARHVFGATSVVVVSQQFHLPRAVWLCQRLGLDAEGAYPPPSYPDATARGEVREVPAAFKAVLDVTTRRLPTYPGPSETPLQEILGRP